MDNYEKLEFLIKQLMKNSEAYYNGKQSITDIEYDNMIVEAKQLVSACNSDNKIVKQANEFLYSEIGAEPTYGKKVKHSQIMGSLNKCRTFEEWKNDYFNVVNTKDFISMPKIDGLSVSIVYNKGKLVQALSRGDGNIGQLITDNIMAIKSIPKTIDYKEEIEFRGEIYMKKSVFNKFNEKGDMKFENPRNAASGSLLQKDPEITGSRNLSLLIHSILSDEVNSESENIMFLNKCSSEFKYVDFYETENISKKTTEEIYNEHIKYWTEKRSKLDYDIDGVVFNVSSHELKESLGSKGKYPNYAIAYKFPAEQKEATIKNIRWQVGRTGKITPVVEIDDLRLSGSTVNNVTVYNYKYAIDHKYFIGNKVMIEKSGEIIPKIVRVIEDNDSENINKPECCPVCAGRIDYDGVNIYCTNQNCNAKIIKKICNYIKTLEIDGIDESTIETLYNKGIVKTIEGLYDVKEAQIARLNGFGERSAKNIVAAIKEKSAVPFWKVLSSLGIEGIGDTSSKDIAKKFKTIEGIYRATVQELEGISGIGELTANNFVKGIRDNMTTISKLSEKIKIVEEKEIKGMLTGLSFCATGTLSKSRDEIYAEIEEQGGIIKNSVVKDLSYLVVGDDVGKTKLEKAKKCGVNMISEEDLNKMLGK